MIKSVNLPPLDYKTKWVVIKEATDSDITGYMVGDIIETYWNIGWYFNPSSSFDGRFVWTGAEYYMPLAEWRDQQIQSILED